MKIAIYTIALNEEKFVDRWFESTREAEVHLIGDTGSHDGTVELAQKLGVQVVNLRVRPWRFDDPRNALLALLPDDIDYCISLDLDEVLVAGWREGLETAFHNGVEWPKYNYVWSWDEKGNAAVEFEGIKIHPRWGVRWKYPIHEIPVACDDTSFVWGTSGVIMHHFPDQEKPRAYYLEMLERAAREDPYSPRLAYYLARDYFFAEDYESASREFIRYLELPGSAFPPERCEAYRFLALIDSDNAVNWLLKAVYENSGRREPMVDLARYFEARQDWKASLDWAERALEVKTRPSEFLVDTFIWDVGPHDCIALASYFLGDYARAVAEGRKALKADPKDTRLLRNLGFYKTALETSATTLAADC